MKLTDVVDRINGNVDRFNTDLEYYIGGEHFDSEELIISKRGTIKDNLGKLGFKFHFAFQDRDVIFMARNPHLRKAGMVRFSGLCSDASYILRSKNEKVISQDFLAVMLQSDRFWDYCESHKVGSVNFANNWSTIANYEFQLPDPKFQRELADKVWAAYEVKQSYLKMIDATQEMVKAQFIEMFGEIDKKRCVKHLKDYASISGGFAFKSEHFIQNGVPIIRISNINNGLVDLDYNICYNLDFWNANPLFRVEMNDILIAMSGATTGKVGMYLDSNPALLNQRVAKVRPIENITTKSFVFMALQLESMYEEIQDTAQGGAQPNISGKQIELLPMPVATYEAQKSFETLYTQAYKSKAELRKSIDAIDKVIKSLINENL